jgi:hypothetical protein
MAGWAIAILAAAAGVLLGYRLQPPLQQPVIPPSATGTGGSAEAVGDHSTTAVLVAPGVPLPLSPPPPPPPPPVPQEEQAPVAAGIDPVAHGTGWSWARQPCDPASLRIDAAGAASMQSVVAAAVAVFRACGVVALSGARPPLGEAVVARHRAALAARLQPYLESRARVRAAMMAVGRRQRSYKAYKRALGSLWMSGALAAEPALSEGYTLRERSAGRLDLQLGWEAPHNESAVTSPPVVLAVAQALLGHRARLKSMHGLVGLAGCEAQQWHRDTPLLFADHPKVRCSPY